MEVRDSEVVPSEKVEAAAVTAKQAADSISYGDPQTDVHMGPAAEVASRLEAGMVYINGASEDLEAPFGGYKMSGNGREWGELAFGEFLETKAIIHSALPAARP